MSQLPSYEYSCTAETPVSSCAVGGSKSFLTSLVSRSCLELDIPGTVFVHPPSSSRENAPPSALFGQVSFRLPVTKAVKSLKVSLIGVTEISMEPRMWERNNHLAQEITFPLPIRQSDNTLPAGTYRFPFRFEIPATAAPSQRSKFGRTMYTVIAKVKMGGWSGGTTRVAKQFFLTMNPGKTDPQQELALSIDLEEVSKELGPYLLSLSSSLFTVSSLLSMHFALPSPPQPVSIQSIGFFIHQDAIIRSASQRDPETKKLVEERPPTQKTLFAVLDGNRPPDQGCRVGPAEWKGQCIGGPGEQPLVELDTGQGYDLKHVARLPCDDVIRPSTHPSTDTQIRISHRLVIELIYCLPQGPRRVLAISKPVNIVSCCCMIDNVVLPLYAESDPMQGGSANRRKGLECVCGATTEVLKFQLKESQTGLTEHTFDAEIATSWRSKSESGSSSASTSSSSSLILENS